MRAGPTPSRSRKEVKLKGLPTRSGDGFADYVLYGDDGKPLAVIEAKKTAKDAREGSEQARQYADALEKTTGMRPVIFFTNGIDIFVWDDAQKYPYRKVYGFYSKDSLEYLVHQRLGKTALALVEPNLAIAGRMYQLEAVKRVTERFASNFRKALVVQATGTYEIRYGERSRQTHLPGDIPGDDEGLRRLRRRLLRPNHCRRVAL